MKYVEHAFSQSRTVSGVSSPALRVGGLFGALCSTTAYLVIVTAQGWDICGVSESESDEEMVRGLFMKVIGPGTVLFAGIGVEEDDDRFGRNDCSRPLARERVVRG